MATEGENVVTETPAAVDTAQGVQPAAADQAQTPQLASSPEPGNTAEPKTMLDAAMKALGQSSEGEAGAATDATPKANETASAEVVEPQGEALDGIPMIPDEEFKALPKTARTAVNLLRQEVRSLRPQADRGRAIDTFMQDAGLTAEEFAQGQDVMALMKRDPAEALKLLDGYAASIRQHLGMDIPDDLRQEVEGGLLSAERAAELSRTRALADNATRTVSQAHLRSVAADVDAWAAEKLKTDPDFARKQSIVQEKAELAIARLGRPVRDSREAIAIVDKAYGDVNAMMRSFAPAPAPTRPTPHSAASAPATASPPKNAYEAAMRGLGQSAA